MAKDRAAGAGKKVREGGRIPRWSRLCVILGAIAMVLSGGSLVAAEVLRARYEGSIQTEDLFGDAAAGATLPPVSDIDGPLNILLVGIDPRPSEPNRLPLADSIMIAHVPAGLDRAYLFSLPRDLVVDIPAFAKADYDGGRGKLNGAMALGSKVPGKDKPDPVRGFELLSKTVAKYTGIKKFDAGAIINFGGFRKIVDAMGGVTMYIDETTKSEHLKPDGSRRPSNNCGCDRPYYGEQKVYKKGKQHLKGWEALDFVRQRYGLKETDYTRQRHQQQFVKAMAEQALSRDVVTNPVKLDKVLRAAGESLVFNGRGHSVVDYALALRSIRPDAITTIKLPGGGVGVGSNYQGEELQPVAKGFFDAVTKDKVDQYVLKHPELINKTR